MTPHRLAKDQAVKRSNALHRSRTNAERSGYGDNCSIWHPAVALLHDLQRFNAGRLGLLVMVAFGEHGLAVVLVQVEAIGRDRVCGRAEGIDILRHNQRSTSAMTKSILPRCAIKSGTKPPRMSTGICCKCGKLGVRIRVR